MITKRVLDDAVRGDVNAADVARPRMMKWMRWGKRTVVGSE